jgi:hypothetical protein
MAMLIRLIPIAPREELATALRSVFTGLPENDYGWETFALLSEELLSKEEVWRLYDR